MSEHTKHAPPWLRKATAYKRTVCVCFLWKTVSQAVISSASLIVPGLQAPAGAVMQTPVVSRPQTPPPLMDLPFPPALPMTLTYSSVRVASGPASSAWRARVRRTECNVEPHRSPPEKTRRGQQGGGCRRKTFRRDVANDTTTVVCVFVLSFAPTGPAPGRPY